MSVLIRVLANALAIWVAAGLVHGFSLHIGAAGTPQLDDARTWISLGVIALVFTLVNAIVKPVLELLTLPLMVLTLGLFGLVVNAAMVLLTGWISQQLGQGLDVTGFWPALWAGVVIGLVNWAVSLLVPPRPRD